MKFALAASFAALVLAAPVEKRTDAPYGDKKGLAYDIDQGASTSILSRANSATWAYNWGAQPNAPKFQQIPMFWGHNGDTNGVMSMIKNQKSPWVLGYNEPDEIPANGGCNMDPQTAYNNWGNDMFKFADAGAKLVCPAVTSWETNSGHAGYAAGLTWLREFASIGNNPSQFRCDAQAIHWYGGGGSAQDQFNAFKGYVEHAHTTVNSIFGKNMDLWITEFAPTPITDVNLMADFLKLAVPYLDGQDWVARYSPFKESTLISGNGLSAAGTAFVNSK